MENKDKEKKQNSLLIWLNEKRKINKWCNILKFDKIKNNEVDFKLNEKINKWVKFRR